MATLPKFPRFEKNSLRPNPRTADPSRGDHAFLQETILVGHFGDWAASATAGAGHTTPSAKPGGLGLDDEVTKPPKHIRRPSY